jgi:hypothetical protein
VTSLDLAQLAIASGTAGGSFGLVFVAVRWSANFIAGRMDRKEAHLDAGTQRMIDRLEKQVEALLERVTRIDEDLAECKRMHAESEADRMRLRAMLQGYGDARQVAQLKVAADRAIEKGKAEQ